MKLTMFHPDPKVLIELAQHLAEAYRPCVVLLEPTPGTAGIPQTDHRADASLDEARQRPEEVQ